MIDTVRYTVELLYKIFIKTSIYVNIMENVTENRTDNQHIQCNFCNIFGQVRDSLNIKKNCQTKSNSFRDSKDTKNVLNVET